ncbi:MAG: hypothetical protein OEW45_16170 [Deltaproteobacteria bacterium]|jgi:hypothetical protein|nr:hypothetical protein [Deltaproteobacteria bacterium]
MKKGITLGLFFCFLAVSFIWGFPANGEEYRSKDVPSDEILSKAASFTAKLSNKYFLVIIGKKQEGDGTYDVYYALQSKGGAREIEINVMTVKKLDNDRWIGVWKGNIFTFRQLLETP